MPAVVSRWHGLWSKYFWPARNTKELTVCGACAARSDSVTAPQLVFSTAEYEPCGSMLIAGSALKCAVDGLPGAGLWQGLGTADAAAVGVSGAAVGGASAPVPLSPPQAAAPASARPRNSTNAARDRGLRGDRDGGRSTVAATLALLGLLVPPHDTRRSGSGPRAGALQEECLEQAASAGGDVLAQLVVHPDA